MELSDPDAVGYSSPTKVSKKSYQKQQRYSDLTSINLITVSVNVLLWDVCAVHAYECVVMS